jgi:Tfp pilus assembly protein PilF
MRTLLLILSFGILSCNQAQKRERKLVNEKTNRTDVINEIERLNKAILSDSSNAKLYGNRATYYLAIQKYDLAERDYIKSIDLNPNDALVWDNYGTLKSRQNDYTSAYSAYSEAVKLSPSDPQFLNNAGWSLLNVGQFEESIKYFDKAINIDGTLHTAYTNKGLALIGLEKKDEGCRLLQLSLERGVKEAKTYIDQYCR